MEDKSVINRMSELLGNNVSTNAQNSTDISIEGMKLFRKVAHQKYNVGFEQVKGNLFEYIEAAKFNVDAAKKGNTARAIVTDSVGRPHDPADIEIVKDSKVVKRVQAKFSTSKNAALDSVRMQSNSKYRGMDRLIRKDNNYTDDYSKEKTSLLNRAKELANKASRREGNIYQEDYKDTSKHLTDELKYENVSSKGTTLKEIKKAHKNPARYEKKFIKKQVSQEIRQTSKNMAVASMISAGISSGVINIFDVFSGKKDLDEAIGKVGSDVVKSGARGGLTGIIAAKIRTSTSINGNRLFSDSMASTVMAGGILDGGVAIYSYAKGDIDEEQLVEELIDTTVKSTATIYYSKAVTAVLGSAANPLIPMATYTAATIVVTNVREILRNAKLAIEENERLTAIYKEATKLAEEKNQEFKRYIDMLETNQSKMLNQFVDSFEYNFENGSNYDEAIESITEFAKHAGIVLQHANFEEFKKAMNSKEIFRLE